MKYALSGLIFVSALIGATLWSSTSAEMAQDSLRGCDLKNAGKLVYGTNCAGCHGAKLEGQANWQIRSADGYLPAPPHDETGHTWHHPDKMLFEFTKYGLTAFGRRWITNRLCLLMGATFRQRDLAGTRIHKSAVA